MTIPNVAGRIELVKSHIDHLLDGPSRPDHTAIAALIVWAETESLAEGGQCRWNQQYFAARHPDCGTTYCIAGQCCIQAGVEMRYVGRYIYGGWEMTYDTTEEDRTVDVVASEILGLNRGQACLLFDANNTIDDLKHISKWLQETYP